MALITLGSLNKQQNNFIKDVAVVFGINTAIHLFSAILVFSTLGFVADMQGVVINDLVQSGLHMFFVLFPQAVSHMGLAPLWSALFFLMIILLGLGQQLVFLDSISLAIADNWPGLFGKDRLKLNIGLCLGMALLGFTICTKVSSFVRLSLLIFAGWHSCVDTSRHLSLWQTPLVLVPHLRDNCHRLGLWRTEVAF